MVPFLVPVALIRLVLPGCWPLGEAKHHAAHVLQRAIRVVYIPGRRLDISSIGGFNPKRFRRMSPRDERRPASAHRAVALRRESGRDVRQRGYLKQPGPRHQAGDTVLTRGLV